MVVDTSRNTLVWTQEVQHKLNALRVVVCGESFSCGLLGAGLHGLGVTQIQQFGSANTQLFYNSKHFGTFTPFQGKLLSAIGMQAFSPDIVVAVNPSKKECEKISSVSQQLSNCSLELCNITNNTISFSKNIDSYYFDYLLQESRDNTINTQHACDSCTAVGCLLENIRRTVHQYDEEKEDYKLLRMCQPKIKTTTNKQLSDLSIAIIGAGGIGTYAALSAALHGATVTIFDDDSIEHTNLNRQCGYVKHVGEKKAPTLVEFINSVNSSANCTSVVGRVGNLDAILCDTFLNDAYSFDLKKYNREPLMNPIAGRTKYDNYIQHHYGTCTVGNELKDMNVILGCVDNKYARLYLNQFCIENNICYIDGATSPRLGKIAIYQPGISATIDQQLALYAMPLPRLENSCAVTAEGSVVMSNIVIGGMMVEILCEYALNPRFAIKGAHYDATALEKIIRC